MEEISPEVKNILAKIHDITNRVIRPAKERGPAHAIHVAQAFMAVYNRNESGAKPLPNNGVSSLRGSNNSDMPV